MGKGEQQNIKASAGAPRIYEVNNARSEREVEAVLRGHRPEINKAVERNGQSKKSLLRW